MRDPREQPILREDSVTQWLTDQLDNWYVMGGLVVVLLGLVVLMIKLKNKRATRTKPSNGNQPEHSPAGRS